MLKFLTVSIVLWQLTLCQAMGADLPTTIYGSTKLSPDKVPCKALFGDLLEGSVESELQLQVGFFNELIEVLRRSGISDANAFEIKIWITYLFIEDGRQDRVMRILKNRYDHQKHERDGRR